MGTNRGALHCECCTPPVFKLMSLKVQTNDTRNEGNAAGPSTWVPLQDSSWKSARDAAHTAHNTQCNTPTTVDSGGSFINYDRACPAIRSYPYLTIVSDYGLTVDIGRWAMEEQYGGNDSGNVRPSDPCVPGAPFTFCNGIWTSATYLSLIMVVWVNITPGSSLFATHGIAKIRYYMKSKTSGDLSVNTFVDAYNMDGACTGTAPVQHCYESSLDADNLQALYGSMMSPGTGATNAQRILLWNAVRGGTQEETFTTDLTDNTTTSRDVTTPATWTPDDVTHDTWFFAVAPDPICFDDAPELDDVAVHPSDCWTTATGHGCSGGFTSGCVSRQSIKGFRSGAITKIEFLAEDDSILFTVLPS